jgi:hypothetical protein
MDKIFPKDPLPTPQEYSREEAMKVGKLLLETGGTHTMMGWSVQREGPTAEDPFSDRVMVIAPDKKRHIFNKKELL